MTHDNVVESYLDILASAISKFKPRFAVINCGTGADGKSTFFHAINYCFGGYCGVCPLKGPALDTRNANDATSLTNYLRGSRIVLTSDCKNVDLLIKSPRFKSASSGDTMYNRGMQQKASKHAPSLKILMIVNTNDKSVSVSEISELTRLKIVK
jgi:phage/plasmid-associated DNA primase